SLSRSLFLNHSLTLFWLSQASASLAKSAVSLDVPELNSQKLL
ncbi:hypothetical protein PanWU01x14_160030, partial [Parasponia andersonii]